MSATEVAHHIFLRVPTFLVGDNDAGPAINLAETARHCLVIGKQPVAVELNPVGETTLYIIKSKWPLNMTRDLNPLPGTEVFVNFPPGRPDLRFHCFNLGVKINVMAV